MLWSITFRFIWLNALPASTYKIASLSSSLNIELKACTAASHPARWSAQGSKSPALSRMFLLKVIITARPRILLITSPILIGLTPGFLSKVISLNAKKASSDPSFPQHLFKHNFFTVSATALQKSRLLSQMMMTLECDATHFHLSLMDLLLPWFHVQFYISERHLFLHMHILHIILPGRVVRGRRILEHLQDVFLWEDQWFV